MMQATLEVASRALAFVSPGDRDTWIRMGMALKAEFGDAARDTWLDWSSASEDFNAGSASSSWRSFKDGGKIGIGSLFSEAKAEGFVFDRADIVVSPEKLAADKKVREERAAKSESDRLARAVAAANRAQSQWRTAAVDGTSPYLERKQVNAESCRFLPDGGLIVPMMRYDFDKPVMVGKQAIAADGTKKYSGGMDKHGAACRLGAVPVDGDVLLVVEGYATGLSVRMAVQTRHPVFVAFDTVGLLPVAKILRAKYPHSRILFCTDDDYLTGDAGRIKAQAAAAAVGNAALVLPAFAAARRADKKDESLPYLTDFNDLHVHESLNAAQQQLLVAVDGVFSSPAPSDAAADDGALPPWVDADPVDSDVPDSPAPLGLAAAPEVLGFVALEWALAHCALVQGSTNVWDSVNKLNMKRPAFIAMVGKESAALWEAHKERRTISPRNLPKTVRGVAAATGGAGDENLVMMLDRYTLLYGTKTVWDADKRMVLSYDAMALARSGDLATRWIGHPLHREIDSCNLVFDPTQKMSLDTHVNMFQGLPIKPVRDDAKAGLVLELLHSLCSGESNGDDVLHWVVQWLAYPLQNPGAKMQTGLLFFGERQGTGKSLFFEGIMRPIYGDHGVTVGQHQLDSTFTGWKSQKLYILFEEILSRADKYSHFGLVKHMITGGDTPINEKNLPTRFEANHANTVMLSNEFQAVPIEPDDRRFMVVEARNPLSPDLLAGLTDGDRVADGVSAAFYDFLMRYPLDDFKAHAKPLMTASKQRMIRFGLPSWDAFYQAWSAEEINAPFCSCLATDLYLAYDRWCSRGNERAITQTKFSELMATRVHRSRQKIYLGGADKQLLTVFKVPSEEEETLSKACQRFRDGADIKDRV
ncbi:PriCT-2 domain-containing protein [Herminiimonas sp. CN]|uniref:PriCT-2 domain-containing protein n=1 Tax=Herminiimonas sp. CN TaxID=1349818 RepID=UPI0009DE37B6